MNYSSFFTPFLIQNAPLWGQFPEGKKKGVPFAHFGCEKV